MTAQSVRMIDVFFIAPFLMYAATKKGLTPADKQLVALIGLGTLLYNGINFIKNR